MKRLFRIFELSKNEQRVVLIVILILITIAFVEYERRVHHSAVEPALANRIQTVSDCCGNGKAINSLIALAGREFVRSRQTQD